MSRNDADRARRLRWNRRLSLEALEHRRVLATLLVEGTAGDDQISAYVENELLTVEVNGASFTVPNGSFDRIEVLAGRGNDGVRIDDSVRQTTLLDGGAGNDRIAAGAGRSLIYGGEGDDSLAGGPQTDVLFGGAGDDRLHGNRGDDYLIGGSGNDELDGGVGNDWLFGDATNTYPRGYHDPVQYALDFMDVNRGQDLLLGDDGNDVLLAGNGNDRADGGSGNDLMLGGYGDDGLGGGRGDDIILGDTIFRDTSLEPAAAEVAGRVHAQAAELVRSIRPAEPLPTNVSFNDHIVGGVGDDLLIGQLGDDVLAGGDGNDQLYGGAGNDRLFGQAGNDLLVGGLGNDYLSGGAGADRIHARDGMVDIICADALDEVIADDIDIFACLIAIEPVEPLSAAL